MSNQDCKPRVYCGTYAKYNAGSIAGKWLCLEDFDNLNDFLAGCAQLHDDERDPELMFQDWENIPSGMVGESWLDPDIWDLMRCDDWAAVMALSKLKPRFDRVELDYLNLGNYESLRDYAEHLAADITARWEEEDAQYFDTAKLENDLKIRGYAYSDGYVFQP